MRREMKYATAIGILIVGVGVWFFYFNPPPKNAGQADLGISDTTEPSAEPAAQPDEMVEVTFGPEPDAVEPVAEETSNVAASPAPIPGPADDPSTDRPTDLDLSAINTALNSTESAAVPQPTGETVFTAETLTPLTLEITTTEAESANATAEPKTHTIQPGDSFSKLAHQYFGDAKYATLISEANPDLDPRRLQVGAKINIPEGPAHDAQTTPAEAPVFNAGRIPEGQRYVVQVGETWYDLGAKFLGNGQRGIELYELNKERVPRDLNLLPAGTVIELPKGVDAQK